MKKNKKLCIKTKQLDKEKIIFITNGATSHAQSENKAEGGRDVVDASPEKYNISYPNQQI